ncbi:nuclear factor 7, brain-like [Latimeria chalumnae]|uniref:nuclear factor 7, brain-like n=1 Tax=Latimeria chalumnae TaxID=7897 RepID=UPI00313CC179
MDSKRSAGDLEDDITCSICQELFKDPVITKCGHNFCRECVCDYWKGNAIPVCPICRADSATSDLITNYTLRNIVEMYKKEGKKSKAQSESVCSEHEEKLKLYCLEDQQAICLVCQTSRKHKNHMFLPIKEAAQEFKLDPEREKQLEKAVEALPSGRPEGILHAATGGRKGVCCRMSAERGGLSGGEDVSAGAPCRTGVESGMEVIENGVGEQKQFEQDGTTAKTRKEDGTNEKDDGNKENRPENRPETRPGKSLYSEALRQSDERDSSTAGYRRKNVVRLRFQEEERKVPDRDYVGKVLLKDSLKFSPLEVFALIHISDTREFDISFRTPVYLERFWQIYEHVKKESMWQDFLAVKITQADIKTITILFKNESVPASDIYFWLSRKSKVLGNLQPIYDSNGFWIGGYEEREKKKAKAGLKGPVSSDKLLAGIQAKEPALALENRFLPLDSDSEAECVVETPSRGSLDLPETPVKEEEELNNSLKPLQDTHQKIVELKEKYRGNLNNIHDETDKIEKQIKEDFEKLHQFLHKEETNLLTDLKKEKEEKEQKMREMEESIVQDLTSVSKIIKDIQQKMDEEDQIFLMTLRDMRERIKKYADYKPREPEAISAADIHGYKYTGSLQYRVWKKMLKFINPVMVILDPNTAAPWLTVSEDLTAVTRGWTRRKNLPDNPERFDQSSCVLGSEGFTSGRHSWVVDVENQIRWFLGVAAESANRKGNIYLRPECGYWTVALCGGGYSALTDKGRTRLDVLKTPRKVLICMDYGAGKVSFSNADDMSHIYTFTHKFKHKIFPFFWLLTVGASLRICNL